MIDFNINNSIALLLSLFAVGVSFYAYQHTKEEFRLRLFDKRFEIYSNVLHFCSFVTYRSDIYLQNMKPQEFEQITSYVKKKALEVLDIIKQALCLEKISISFLKN